MPLFSHENIRTAHRKDIPALVALEEICFSRDRFLRNTFYYLVTQAHALCTVVEAEAQIVAASIVLFRRKTSSARLYNFAILPSHQGSGLSTFFLAHTEKAVFERGYQRMHLEVRADNARAIAFYSKQGYEPQGTRPAYYDDQMTALCFSKRLD